MVQLNFAFSLFPFPRFLFSFHFFPTQPDPFPLLTLLANIGATAAAASSEVVNI